MTRSTRLRPALAVVLTGLFALGACGGDDDDAAGASTPAASASDRSASDADITIATFQFQPNPATVAGGTVTVTNADDTTHTFTSGTPDTPDGAFRLELTGPGATGTVEVEPGAYRFFCEIHTSMSGEVTVT